MFAAMMHESRLTNFQQRQLDKAVNSKINANIHTLAYISYISWCETGNTKGSGTFSHSGVTVDEQMKPSVQWRNFKFWNSFLQKTPYGSPAPATS